MRDNIEVEVSDREDGSKAVVITDQKARRAWSGEGADTGKAATEAVRRLLGDRRAREYVE